MRVVVVAAKAPLTPLVGNRDSRGPHSQQHGDILISNFIIRMTDLHEQYPFRQQAKQHTFFFQLRDGCDARTVDSEAGKWLAG